MTDRVNEDLSRLDRYPADKQLDWLRQACRSNIRAMDELRANYRTLAAHVLTWPEVRERTLTVKDAQLLHVCRLCKGPPKGRLMTNFGREYACWECLVKAGCINEAEEAGPPSA
jgi:hypothetical protein